LNHAPHVVGRNIVGLNGKIGDIHVGSPRDWTQSLKGVADIVEKVKRIHGEEGRI